MIQNAFLLRPTNTLQKKISECFSSCEACIKCQTYQSTACFTAPAALRAARSDPELKEVSECDPFLTDGSLITVL